ncbi:MAG: hypothetical protein A2V77_11415 [Anaeromyxobacter sp. RBG_16_69_14]|nr:MAG: hypothetical protein A2V77_11415 [Anaeromyxobacter sp. RBG_16_69_14]
MPLEAQLLLRTLEDDLRHRVRTCYRARDHPSLTRRARGAPAHAHRTSGGARVKALDLTTPS